MSIVGDQLVFTAVVRPQKAETLVRALLASGAVGSCHAVEVRGSGNQRPTGSRRVLGFLPKVAVVGSLEAGGREAVESIVQAQCPTGQSGDGKIFFQAVHRSIDLAGAEV